MQLSMQPSMQPQPEHDRARHELELELLRLERGLGLERTALPPHDSDHARLGHAHDDDQAGVHAASDGHGSHGMKGLIDLDAWSFDGPDRWQALTVLVAAGHAAFRYTPRSAVKVPPPPWSLEASQRAALEHASAEEDLRLLQLTEWGNNLVARRVEPGACDPMALSDSSRINGECGSSSVCGACCGFCARLLCCLRPFVQRNR